MSVNSFVQRGKRLVAAGAVAAFVVVGASAPGIALGARPDAGAASPLTTTPLTWTQQTLTTQPDPRHDAGIAFDRVRQNTVLFGGTNDLTVIPRTTWIWNGSTWTGLTTAFAPPALSASAMDWDGTLNEIMMFAGNAPPCNPICTDKNTTYEFNGTNWTQMHPATQPPARAGGRIVYDSLHKQVVLFGGADQSGGFLSDTWTWDGVNWTQKFPATVPPGRYYPQMAYDPVHQRVVLFSGLTWNNFMLTDTWTWDGTNWTQQNPTTLPAGRYDASLVYDVSLKAVVLFAGDTQARSDLTLNDTWAWTGSNWKQFTVNGTLPSARWRQSMVFDPLHANLVMFGGKTGGSTDGILLGDTWTLHQ